jgi:hypothetical protein
MGFSNGFAPLFILFCINNKFFKAGYLRNEDFKAQGNNCGW